MMHIGSTFFATFSLRELVKDKQLGTRSAPSGAERCGIPGGIPGGFAGGIGGGSGYAGSGQSVHHKTESLSLPVSTSASDRFEEREFITSLKADVEKEILDSAAITRHGDIDGDFNSSEFYFEYREEEIRGRIVISGKIIGSAYCLRADLEELGEGGGFLLAPEEFRSIKPEGDYYVVALKEGDPLAQDDKLHYLGVKLVKESVRRIPRSITQEQIKDLQDAEVWSLFKVPPQMKQLLQEKGIERRFELPEEYEGYEKVYFLNEVALRMYRDGGIALEALKKISAAEMPNGCSRSLRGPYIRE